MSTPHYLAHIWQRLGKEAVGQGAAQTSLELGSTEATQEREPDVLLFSAMRF